ncbi:MAG TPA: molecular chaperone SurA [Chromatiales bacterium]|jgi:peptidyl-prolyl cis-trans isomerase SurA|nr:molecular chaperone SurA [Chromatiaceae bacterium]HIN81717.1 molecular chaperone SurA [Chromatiales bacterium]HIO54039.1 molecular chaperone SurA [Chromatiales bacterium]
MSLYRIHVRSCLLLILTSLLLPAASVLADTERRTLDWIVAQVNNDVIVASELGDRANRLRAELEARNTPLPDDRKFLRQVLERLVIEHIQLQLAASTGIIVDDARLDVTVEKIARQNDFSIQELADHVRQDGLSMLQFREQLRTEITIKQLRSRHVESRINVSEHEIDTMLTHGSKTGADPNAEFQLLHILISVPEAASSDEIQQAKARATETIEKLRGGEDFRQTAIAVSDGRQALNGGDLGWRKLGQLPTIFVDAVTQMSVGDISDLIRSASGFHIIKVEGGQIEERKIITQTHARHILLKTDALNSDQRVRDRLVDLRERVLQGEDFNVLAKANSQDTASAIDGGDLDWMDPGSFVPAFETEMNALDIGQISAPFQARFGWHIVQVLDRRDHDSTVEFKRAQARKLLRKRKLDEELNLWLRRLRDEAYVEYRSASR